jgi:hypothetical protein
VALGSLLGGKNDVALVFNGFNATQALHDDANFSLV